MWDEWYLSFNRRSRVRMDDSRDHNPTPLLVRQCVNTPFFLSVQLALHIYIYIYRERERGRAIFMWMGSY